jgi:hypothetical protein
MPNAFLKPDVIAAAALERLRRQLILPRLVTRLGVADFMGAKDDTVNIRVPAVLNARDYEWRTRNNPIVLDTLEEVSIPVRLDSHIYSAIAVTDEELTLDIVSFTVQVLTPQVIAVAERLEAMIADVIEAASFAAGDIPYDEDPSGDEAGFYRAAVDARKALNDAHVPLTGRVILVGSAVEAAALKEDALRQADQAGSTDALRNATIGQIAGFDVVASQSVAEDFAVAFHPSAFAFANVAPAVPAGVSFGSSQDEQGLAMRWIRDYDPMYLQDRSVLSSFAGAASVEDGRDPADSDGTPGALNNTNVRAVKIAFTASS